MRDMSGLIAVYLIYQLSVTGCRERARLCDDVFRLQPLRRKEHHFKIVLCISTGLQTQAFHIEHSVKVFRGVLVLFHINP